MLGLPTLNPEAAKLNHTLTKAAQKYPLAPAAGVW